MNIWMSGIFTKLEVKITIVKLCDDKAPSPDGFTMRIFKVLWTTIKLDLVDGLAHLYMGRNMVREMNHTFLTLILKIEGAKRMEDFRPIFCVNLIYESHSKMMAERLAQVVPFLLSPVQEAFTSGRYIASQYKIAREMMNGFSRKVTAWRFCLSLDLKKVFDSIDWE